MYLQLRRWKLVIQRTTSGSSGPKTAPAALLDGMIRAILFIVTWPVPAPASSSDPAVPSSFSKGIAAANHQNGILNTLYLGGYVKSNLINPPSRGDSYYSVTNWNRIPYDFDDRSFQ